MTCPWCGISLPDVQMYAHVDDQHNGWPPNLVLAHGREHDDYGPGIMGEGTP